MTCWDQVGVFSEDEEVAEEGTENDVRWESGPQGSGGRKEMSLAGEGVDGRDW